MSFRDRPEYQQWREDVFRLFGDTCIRCGHESNLHAHHVRPVNSYPELAFDPRNGVPLCGNCHNDVNSNELAYVPEFERRQQELLQGIGADESGSVRRPEDVLREQADQDPTNSDIVGQWFSLASDSQSVVNFYNLHRSQFRKTTQIYVSLAQRLFNLNRHADAIRAADAAADLAKREPETRRPIAAIAQMKSLSLNALDRKPEALAYLHDVVALFQGNDHPRLLSALHTLISLIHFGHETDEDSPAWSEHAAAAAKHAAEAARLCPRDVDALSLAASTTYTNKDYASSCKYANAILSIATTRAEKIQGHLDLAAVYKGSKIYDQAMKELRQVMELDANNTDAMREMAFCLFMDSRRNDALTMAKRCLLADPGDEICLLLVERLDRK